LFNLNEKLEKAFKITLKFVIIYYTGQKWLILRPKKLREVCNIMFRFLKKYHDAIKAGKITLTYQPWDTLRVLRGKIYRAQHLGLVRVLDVDFRRLSEVTEEEARRCGADSLETFRRDLEELAGREIDFSTERAVRVEFEFIGEDIEDYKKAMGNVKDSELNYLKEQLIIQDQKSARPWVIKTLQMLRDKGYISAKDLEARLNVPSEQFRKNMKQLRDLNLIRSSQKKGYCITPLGIKVLRSLTSIKKAS